MQLEISYGKSDIKIIAVIAKKLPATIRYGKQEIKLPVSYTKLRQVTLRGYQDDS